MHRKSSKEIKKDGKGKEKLQLQGRVQRQILISPPVKNYDINIPALHDI